MPRDPLIVGRIPPDLSQRVDAYVIEHATTRSAVIRDALTRYLAPVDATTRPTPQASVGARQRKRTLDACKHRVKAGRYCPRCATLV